MLVLALLAIGVPIVVWFLWRANELFYVSVRDGKLLLVRGRVPVSLMQAFADAVIEPTIARGSIRAYRTERGGQLSCGGDIPEGREQRMRNAFMLYPSAQLRSAPRIGRPTLGQVMGIAWLAWMLDRRS
ncbi:MAG: DUF3634 family protein [Deltaproteobacteria bacterium]|nr:DUF3634 family protein [Deltaproteobacteria bacterium]